MPAMMDHMMGGAMMWGMSLIGLLVIIVLLLAAAALIKYHQRANARKAHRAQWVPASSRKMRFLERTSAPRICAGRGTGTDDQVLRRLRVALDNLYGDRIERVVLFGSRARGDAHEHLITMSRCS